MTTIGILSDTHDTFDDKLRRFLTPCDELWHAGDFGSQELADRIADFRRVRGVHGNIDGGATRIVYPRWQSFECDGVRVLMTHIGGYPEHYEREALERIVAERPTVFISGHSHILKVIYDKRYEVLHINPGAAGISGFHNVRTAIRLTINDGQIGEMEVGQWEKR